VIDLTHTGLFLSGQSRCSIFFSKNSSNKKRWCIIDVNSLPRKFNNWSLVIINSFRCKIAMTNFIVPLTALFLSFPVLLSSFSSSYLFSSVSYYLSKGFVEFEAITGYEDAFLMVHCEAAARVIVDGAEIGQVKANEFKRFTVIAGDHAVKILAVDGSKKWEGKIHTAAGEQSLLEPKLISTDPTVGVPGVFKDPYDNTVYKTVKIKKLEWFAENYKRDIFGSDAPAKKPSKINSYGRLYTYGMVSTPPPGWRLPTEADYKSLLSEYKDPYVALVGGKSGFNAIKFPGTIVDFSASNFGNSLCLRTSTAGPSWRSRNGKKYSTMRYLVIFAKEKKIVFGDEVPSLVTNWYSVRFVRDL
jgi:uncharacterized protein (TIGR02145 family)